MDFTTNYCGMYWSDGKFQSSVANGTATPVNELDRTCMEHDASYALATSPADLVAADNKFYEQNFLKGPKRTFYAILVKHGNKLARMSVADGSFPNAGYTPHFSLRGARVEDFADQDLVSVCPSEPEPTRSVNSFFSHPQQNPTPIGLGAVYGPSLNPPMPRTRVKFKYPKLMSTIRKKFKRKKIQPLHL